MGGLLAESLHFADWKRGASSERSRDAESHEKASQNTAKGRMPKPWPASVFPCPWLRVQEFGASLQPFRYGEDSATSVKAVAFTASNEVLPRCLRHPGAWPLTNGS